MADPFYGTFEGFQAYWTDRANVIALAFEDDDVNAALLVGSEWIDAAFRASFAGTKVGQRAQIREWPRIGVVDIYGYVVDNSTAPAEVEKATYEAALRQLQTPGVFFKDYSPSKYKAVAISGAINVQYAIGTAFDFQTQMPQIAAVLAPILTAMGDGTFSGMSGAVGRV